MSLGKSFFVGFVVGLLPRCVSGLLLFFDETQIWLGDLRVVSVVCLVCVLVVLICLTSLDLLCPCTNVSLTAYAHVRTEPQCDIGHTGGKKIGFRLAFSFVINCYSPLSHPCTCPCHLFPFSCLSHQCGQPPLALLRQLDCHLKE